MPIHYEQEPDEKPPWWQIVLLLIKQGGFFVLGLTAIGALAIILASIVDMARGAIH